MPGRNPRSAEREAKTMPSGPQRISLRTGPGSKDHPGERLPKKCTVGQFGSEPVVPNDLDLAYDMKPSKNRFSLDVSGGGANGVAVLDAASRF